MSNAKDLILNFGFTNALLLLKQFSSTNLKVMLNKFIFSTFVFSDLSENQIQAIPRKAFRGAVDIKNL